MTLHAGPDNQIVLVPLIGNQQTEEAHWLGAMLSRLLIEHLSGAGLSVLDYDATVRHIVDAKLQLPLTQTGMETVSRSLKPRALVYGRYVCLTKNRRCWVST
jgi:hypothetical protein